MKICFFAPADNYHTKKWAGWFSKHGHEVHVISFSNGDIPGATLHHISSGASWTDSDVKKIKYLLQAKKVRKIIENIKPDIVNAHYATSYGTVAALSGIKGYVLSVWGSDVYDFPNKSMLHKMLVKYSLHRAGHIFSTSEAMALETKKYTNKHIDITPFGVDMELFNPKWKDDKESDFVIGTVRTLDSKYGIDNLLRAVAYIKKDRPEIPLKMRIAGKGPKEDEYKELACSLGIDDITTWLGFVPQEVAAREWANMDVAVVPSTLESESFGVSAVEAEASGTAVIISDIPGLMEATKPGETSVVVPKKNVEALALAITDLYDHPDKRNQLGKNGRSFAEKLYKLNHCFENTKALFGKNGEGMVDLDVFNPDKRTRGKQELIIGLVKGLKEVYGIDLLLEAVAAFKAEKPDLRIQLRIAGRGDAEDTLKKRAEELKLDCVEWLGFITQVQAAWEWAHMDIAVIPSRMESFGVSAVEAQACGTPLIVSDISGLMETTLTERGFNVFGNGEWRELKDTLNSVYDNKERALEIAKAARTFVLDRYEINSCFERIERLFKNIQDNKSA